MVSFLKRKSEVAETESPLAWPLPFAALAVSFWVTAVSYLVTVSIFTFVWITTPNNPIEFGTNLQAALLALLHVHVLPISFAGLTISIAPLFATLALVWLVQAATLWAIRSVIFYHPASALGLIFGIGIVHGAVLAGLSVLTGNAVSTTRAFVAGLVVGLVGAIWAVLRSANEPIIEVPLPKLEVGERTRSWLKPQSPYLLVVGLWNGFPTWWKNAFKVSLRFLIWNAIFGFIAFLVLLITRADEMHQLIALLSTDALSFMFLYLWSLLYLPVIFGWVIVLMLGQSVTLGLGSSLSLFNQAVAPLPVVPILGLIPPVLPDQLQILLLFPTAASFIVTRGIFRREQTGPLQIKLILKTAFGLFVSVFILFFPIGLLTQGSIGAARFEVVGADLIKPSLAAVGFVFIGFIVQSIIWFAKAGNARSELASKADSPT